MRPIPPIWRYQHCTDRRIAAALPRSCDRGGGNKRFLQVLRPKSISGRLEPRWPFGTAAGKVIGVVFADPGKSVGGSIGGSSAARWYAVRSADCCTDKIFSYPFS
jgi:hypothetical protein